MDQSPIGACGSCEDCHAYEGPEGSKLLSTRDIPYDLEETSMVITEEVDSPPQFRVTGDNWKLTPLTAGEFAFIYDMVRSEREEKAKRVNQTVAEIPTLEMEKVPPEQMPVLTWASPKEFERVIDFAARMRRERDEARLIAGTLKGLAMSRTSKAVVNQAIRDVLDLEKRLTDSFAGIADITP